VDFVVLLYSHGGSHTVSGQTRSLKRKLTLQVSRLVRSSAEGSDSYSTDSALARGRARSGNNYQYRMQTYNFQRMQSGFTGLIGPMHLDKPQAMVYLSFRLTIIHTDRVSI